MGRRRKKREKSEERKGGRRSWMSGQKGKLPVRDYHNVYLYLTNSLHILKEWSQTWNDLQELIECHVLRFHHIVEFMRSKEKNSDKSHHVCDPHQKKNKPRSNSTDSCVACPVRGRSITIIS